LKAFVLATAYQKTPVNQCASVRLWRWPEMERFITLAAPGSMFEMSNQPQNWIRASRRLTVVLGWACLATSRT
jgi:hypothetical protein